MEAKNVNIETVTKENLIQFREGTVNNETGKTYTQQEFADILGLKRSTYGAYEAGRNNINLGQVEKLEEKLNKKVSKSINMGNMGKKHDTSHNKNNTGLDYPASIQELIHSNKCLAEAQLLVAKSNSELAIMLRATDGVYLKTNLTFEARFSDFLELLADVGSGKKWTSKQEAVAELSKRFHGKKVKI